MINPLSRDRARLVAEDVRLTYGQGRVVVDGLDLAVPDGSFTVVVGPNACGKSTVLRAFARLLSPVHGSVLLDGQDVAARPAKEVARVVGLLPQTATAPEGITVADLVARGRFPHQGLLRQWSREDERVIRDAMRRTGVLELARRPVDQLSGGQRQRAWVAMALAQQTPLLLLDEPTTFLDMAHQVELLELLRHLNEEGGVTVVAVLHDLNQACRYATHLVAMAAGGAVVAQGDPAEVVTADLVHRVFGLECVVVPDPVTGTPLTLPLAGRRAAPHTGAASVRR